MEERALPDRKTSEGISKDVAQPSWWSLSKLFMAQGELTDEELHLLQSLGLSISHADDLRSVLYIVLHNVCRIMHWDYAEIWSPSADGTVLEHTLASYARARGLEKFALLSDRYTFPPGAGLAGRVWISQQPVWVPDITSDSSFLRSAYAAEAGLKAGVAIPVLGEEEVIGIAIFYASEAREEDERFVRLTSAILAMVMQWARTLEETGKQEESLQRRVTERAAQLQAANLELEREILEHQQVLNRLRMSEKRLAEAQQLAHLGSWEWDIGTNKVTWSDELFRIYGLEPQEFEATFEGYLSLVHRDDREWVKQDVVRAVHEKGSFSHDYRMIRADGTVRVIHSQGETVVDEAGNSIKMRGTAQDISERKAMEEQLRSRVRQQAVVSDLSQRALAGTDVSALLHDAVMVVAETLAVEYCNVLELLPDGERLLLRAGTGWKEGLVGHAVVASERATQAGYALRSSVPVVVEDLSTETRFSGPALLLEHGVVSGLSVVIQGVEGPFGVLGAHTTQRRIFTQEDVHFVQAVANVLAQAIERSRAEESLSQREERYRLLFERNAAAIYQTTVDAHVVDCNLTFARLLGYTSRDEVLQHRASDFYVDPAERDVFIAALQSADALTNYELRMRRTDGSQVWVLKNASIIRGQGESSDEIEVTLIDITERKRVEEALRRSEAQFRRLFNDAPIGMALTSANGTFLEVNTALRKMLEYTEHELSRLNLLEITRPEDMERDMLLTGQMFAGEIPMFKIEKGFITKNQQVLWAEVTATVIRDQSGRPVHGLCMIQDITERRHYEQHLEEHFAAQAQMLGQLMTAQEVERRRLSRDIHDGPLQSLGVSLMAIDRAIRRLERGEHELVQRELQGLRVILGGTVTDVRAVLADVSLDLLKTYGLKRALTDHIEILSDLTGINVEFHSSVRRRLPPNVELLMYRLAQEALANVRKHAKAKNVRVSIKIKENKLYLTILDDGVGFDVAETLQRHQTGKGLGLRSMLERVQAAGGDLQITSEPGKGTQLEFWCPIPDRRVDERRKGERGKTGGKSISPGLLKRF